MKKFLRPALLFFIPGLISISLSSQESINSAGNNAFGNTGSVSYSVGQPAYEAYSGNEGSVTQGIQQPYVISETTGQGNDIFNNLSISIFPNPVQHSLRIDLSELSGLENVRVQLFDIHGKALLVKKVESPDVILMMKDYKPAVYLLKIEQKNKNIRTFRIVKN